MAKPNCLDDKGSVVFNKNKGEIVEKSAHTSAGKYFLGEKVEDNRGSALKNLSGRSKSQ